MQAIGNIIIGALLFIAFYWVFVKLSGWNPIRDFLRKVYDFVERIIDIWRYGP